MDFLKEALKSQTGHKPEAEHKPDPQAPNHTKPHRQPSTSELMSSAKVVAGAAKAKLGHTNEKLDNKKVAGAAGDLLDGVMHYGKLEENVGIGKYVGKAENYLHKYETSHSGAPTSTHAAGAGAEGKKKEEGHSAGDYFKMAEGFLKK